MTGTLLRDRLSLILVATAYLAAMLLSHLLVIAPLFAYRGLEFNPASIGMLSLASAIAVLPTIWMPLNVSRPSVLSYFIIYFLLYIPACVVPICTLEYEPQRYLSYLICIAVCYWGLGRIYHLNLARLPQTRLPGGLYWTLLITMSAMISLLICNQFGLRFQMPSLRGEIYEVRDEYRHAIAGSYFAYLIMIQVKVLAPLCVIWGVHKRKLMLILFGLSSQLLVFVNAGIKTVLFSSLFIVGLYFILNISRRKLFLSMGIALIGVIAGSRIADKLLDDQEIYFSSIFVRRVILTPGLLSGYYFDFFSDHPKVMYGHSVLDGYVSYPYEDTPARVVATEYFGVEGMSANANFWADGFANLGLPGVVLATALLGGVLWLFDSIAIGVDQRVATLILAMPSMALVNSGLLTVLLTHGLMFAMILLYFLPQCPRTTRGRLYGITKQLRLPYAAHG